MLFWHVPAPNEALLISGSKRRSDATQFRIVTGHGSFVLPVKQRARKLSLALREAEITEECITNQGIRLNVRAVAAFKVGDDQASIANAARRFLSEQDRMEVLVGRVFAGHLRSIIGGLTVEQIIRERDRVAQEIKEGSHSEMEKLGIVVDALEIQEIEDSSGYINNLAAPHAAAIASQARIAKAKAELEAAERELDAAAMKAQYERDMAIKQAGYQAETEQARARAAQAGPLTEAQASQEVIAAADRARAAAGRAGRAAARGRGTAAGRRRGVPQAHDRRGRPRPGQVRDRGRGVPQAHDGRGRPRPGQARGRGGGLPAEDAGRRAGAAVQVRADADAHAERSLAEGQADANRAWADSLRQGNQELIAADRLMENLPAIVESAARGLANANLTVLNGTQGVNEVVAGLIGQGMSILDLVKKAAANGHGGAPAQVADGRGPAELN